MDINCIQIEYLILRDNKVNKSIETFFFLARIVFYNYLIVIYFRFLLTVTIIKKKLFFYVLWFNKLLILVYNYFNK